MPLLRTCFRSYWPIIRDNINYIKRLFLITVSGSTYQSFYTPIVLPEDGPRRLETSRFIQLYNINVNLTQLYAFIGLNHSNCN